MVRIMGNSSERVPIKDLGDVVFYKQLKEYTDQEYEKSKDLKEALNRGKIIIIEKAEIPRGSVDIPESKNKDSVSLKDLKTVLRELLPEFKGSGVSESALKGAVREIAPLIVDMVRQEISKIPVGSNQIVQIEDIFQGSEYVPNVTSDGMISNVDIKKTEVSGNAVSDNLAALKKLKK